MSGNSNQYTLGFLLQVITVSGNVYRFQNFQREELFLYNDNEYIYTPFNYNPPSRNTTLDNQNTAIILPNIPIIIASLVANNYFRDAVVEVVELQFDFPTVPPINLDLMLITNYEIVENQEENQITLTLEAPFNNLSGKIPSVYYLTGYNNTANDIIGYVPEVPLYTKPQFQ